MNRFRYTSATLTLLVASLALVGCSSDMVPEPTTSPAAALSDNQELAKSIYDCVTEKGWEVTLNAAQGSIMYAGPIAQEDQYVVDRTACEEAEGPPEADFTTWDDTRWEEAYAAQKDTAQCLEGLGVTVGEIPSFQAFKDSWLSGNTWIAYNSVATADQGAFEEYLAECPQP